MELMKISELVILFSSSCSEECIYMEVPFINIELDPKHNRNKYLYNKLISRTIPINKFNNKIFKKTVDTLMGSINENGELIKDIFKKYKDMLGNYKNLNMMTDWIIKL